MPIVRHRTRCGASNAFRLRYALWKLFLEYQQPQRTFSSSPTFREDGAQVIDRKSDDTRTTTVHPIRAIEGVNTYHGRSEKRVSQQNHIDSKSLSNTLENLRNANRDSVLRKVAVQTDVLRIQVKRPDHPALTPSGRAINHYKVEAIERLSQPEDEEPSYEDAAEIDTLFPPHPPPEIRIKRLPSQRDKISKTASKFKSILEEKKKVTNVEHQSKEDSARGGPPQTIPVVAKGKGQGKRVGAAKYQKNSTQTEVLEYDGQNVLPHSKATTPEREFPWMKGQGETWQSERLSNEIKLFYAYIKPTRLELAARRAVIQETQTHIADVLPSHLTEVFGSHRTGLMLANSDIDLRLYNQQASESTTKANMAPRWHERKSLNRDLGAVWKVFDKGTDYILCHMRHARYPLMSMQHKASGLDLQLVCSNDTTLSQATMKKYMEEDADIEPIFSLLKIMLDVRGLSDVYRGGMGSYSLFMMIVASWKLERVYGIAKWGLARKLEVFFDVYRKFDQYTQCLAVEHQLEEPAEELSLTAAKSFAHSALVFEKQDLPTAMISEQLAKESNDEMLAGRHHLSVVDHAHPYMLCLQDPADPRNDLGRKCYGYKHIKETLQVLRLEMRAMRKLAPDSERSLIAPLVGSCFDAFKRRREIAEGYGKFALDSGLIEPEGSWEAASSPEEGGLVVGANGN